MDSKKYTITFVITVLIFGTALYISNSLNERKIATVRDVESRVSLEILASETQFNLLEETSCKNITPSGFLSRELGSLGERLSYAEAQGFRKSDVESLKQSYFLLEIKDYLLMKKVTEKCGNPPTFILYFYSSDGDCPECDTMGAVLTELRNRYPSLRVYSFDYHFDLEAIRTLIEINKIENRLPALMIGGETYYGLRTVDELLTEVPALKKMQTEAQKAANASSTKATTTKSR